MHEYPIHSLVIHLFIFFYINFSKYSHNHVDYSAELLNLFPVSVHIFIISYIHIRSSKLQISNLNSIFSQLTFSLLISAAEALWHTFVSWIMAIVKAYTSSNSQILYVIYHLSHSVKYNLLLHVN